MLNLVPIREAQMGGAQSIRYVLASDIPPETATRFMRDVAPCACPGSANRRRAFGTSDGYCWLDAAQLIKHTFGLVRTFQERQVPLLYLFWEPSNSNHDPIFAAQQAEIAEFANRVAGSVPSLMAMSYPELWEMWRSSASTWLGDHLDALDARYVASI